MRELDVLPAEDGGQSDGGRGRLLQRPQAAAVHAQGNARQSPPAAELQRGDRGVTPRPVSVSQLFQNELSIGHQILHSVIAEALQLLQRGEVEDR